MKNNNDLNYEDVTNWDANLIKNIATNKLTNTVISDPIRATMLATFEYIMAKGMKIVVDDTRENTWSTRKDSNYLEYIKPRTDW